MTLKLNAHDERLQTQVRSNISRKVEQSCSATRDQSIDTAVHPLQANGASDGTVG